MSVTEVPRNSMWMSGRSFRQFDTLVGNTFNAGSANDLQFFQTSQHWGYVVIDALDALKFDNAQVLEILEVFEACRGNTGFAEGQFDKTGDFANAGQAIGDLGAINLQAEDRSAFQFLEPASVTLALLTCNSCSKGSAHDHGHARIIHAGAQHQRAQFFNLRYVRPARYGCCLIRAWR